MIEFIITITVTVLILLFTAIFFIFFYKKEEDANDSCETKSTAPANKQTNSAIKKTKKKKGVNNLGDSATENDRSENMIQSETKEIYEPIAEVIIPVKSHKEAASPDKNKKRSKVKHVSGDKISSDAEKNDNQSNTLLGRNHDNKLQEEIQSLLKKLDDISEEKRQNESALEEVKTKMEEKERENDSLKTNLTNITAQVNKLKSDLNSEKEKSSKILTDKENTKKQLENQKTQIMHDNEGHKEMYKKYEERMEQLKSDMKTQQTELTTLNKKLQTEQENATKINTKYNEVNTILTEKLEELKKKEANIHTFEAMINDLKRTVEDLRRGLAVKEEEVMNLHKGMYDQKSKLQATIDRLEQENKNKASEIINLSDQVSHLLAKNEELNSKIIKSKQEFIEIDENNNRLQVTIHQIEKETENNRRTIAHLEETNIALQTSASHNIEELTSKLALKEEEINKRSMESVAKLEQIIATKEEEMKKIKINESALESKMHFLNCTVEELTKAMSSKDEVSLTKKNEMSEHIKRLEEDIIDKISELTVVKKNETLLQEQVSSLNQLVEKLRTGSGTNLENIVYDLREECDEKKCEIENLKKHNDSLLESVSSAHCEIEKIKERTVVKEEVGFSQNADVNVSNELRGRIELLSTELKEKERQVKELLEETSFFKNLPIKEESADRSEELNRKILELTKEIIMLQEQSSQEIVEEKITVESIVPLKSECENVDKDEIENLRSHISKLEKELKGMQGRYYVLKEDSVKVNDNDKPEHRIVLSDINVVSIPPNDIDTCAPVMQQEQDNDLRSMTHDSLHEAIDRLNSEIEVQRITNQKLSGQLTTKENEVNVLKQCLLGLDGSLNHIGIMANELQKSCSVTQTEKNSMKCQYERLLKDHELLRQRFIELEKQSHGLNNAVNEKSNDNDEEMAEKMNILQEENYNLRIQLEQYRDSLERTEKMLEKIQSSVDKEEAEWVSSLRLSEQDCTRLEMKVRELTCEIEELKSDNVTETSNMIASVTSGDNGTVISESKKKRKRKNKKKKNKKSALQSNGI